MARLDREHDKLPSVRSWKPRHVLLASVFVYHSLSAFTFIHAWCVIWHDLGFAQRRMGSSGVTVCIQYPFTAERFSSPVQTDYNGMLRGALYDYVLMIEEINTWWVFGVL